MSKHRSSGTACWALLLALCGSVSVAQPILFHAVATPAPSSVTIHTPQGDRAVNSSPVEPSPDLVVVIAATTLLPEDTDSIKKALPILYKATAGVSTLRLAILSNNEVHLTGPFRTARELQVGIRTIAPDSSVDTPPYATRYYSDLPDLLRQFGTDWTSVLLIARLPSLDPALSDFASTFLTAKFLAQRTRFSYWNLAVGPTPFLDAAVRFTGGTAIGPDLQAAADFFKAEAQTFAELSWEEKTPIKGFDLHKDELPLPDGTVSFPHLSLGAGVEMPDLDRYTLYRQQLQILTDLQNQKGKEEQFRKALDTVLSINAGDRQALRTGADFFNSQNDHKDTLTLLSSLAELEPDNGPLFAGIGHHLFQIADLPASEKALLRARELNFTNAVVSEELARIHLAREDFAGVLSLLDETLRVLPQRQDLWFLRADSAAKADNWTVQADSLEHALKLGGTNIDRRTSLVRLYLGHNDPGHASAHVDVMVAQMPADVTVCATYATFLEQLKRPEDALQLWKKTIEVDTSHEPAHFAVTRLLMAKNDISAALTAADAGIAAAPKSARIHLMKAQLLEQQGEIYAARRALSAAASLDDAALLEHAAKLEETYGRDGPKIYQHLTELYAKAESAELPRVLERGLQVSLRDADDEHARWFSEKLETAHLAKPASHPASPGIWVPGGFAALAFMAHGKAISSPDDFLIDYARSILRNVGSATPDPYIESLHEYFERINSLIQLGHQEKDRVVLSVSLNDKASLQRTEKVMAIFGWKLVRSKDRIAIESGVKAKQARRQDLASALAVDQVGMAKAFSEGKAFEFEIPFEWATIALTEPVWQAEYAGDKLPFGLVEALPRNLRLARVYLGLSAVDRVTAEAIVSSIGLKPLVEKHSTLSANYSSALAVADGRVQTPGGIRATDFWKRLLGVSPSDPNHFLRTLFEKDEGRVLEYFFTLSHLDSEHQRFFTLNDARISRFYDLFRESPEVKAGAGRMITTDSFGAFLRGVRLDEDSSVDFPGSPEVWMVVKQSNSAAQNTHLLNKAHQKAAPDVEDEILIRLAHTQYKNMMDKRSELDNFLAVVRIDEHRTDPLDEASAIALAQNFPRYSTLYPYFSVFTGLSAREFNQLFRFGDKLKSVSQLDLNLILGSFHSLLELLRIALTAGSITEKQSTELFFQLCDTFARAASPADYAQASLNLIRNLLSATGSTSAPDADAAIRNLLIVQHAPIAFELGAPREIDSTKVRRADFDHVLALQNIPKLQPLFDIITALRAIAAAKESPASQFKTLESAVSLLPSVEVAKELKQGKVGKALNAAEKERLPALIARLRQKSKAKKVNPKDLEKLEQEFLAELQPAVRLALSGLVYAFYFRSDDLLVAEDPLLVRKHRFVNIAEGPRSLDFVASEVKLGEDPKRGSFFLGGFSEFAVAVARASLAGSKYDGLNGMDIAAAQIAAIRAAPMADLLDSDQRLLGLKLRVGREWCVRAAFEPQARQDLSEETLGLLSSTRRLDLLNGLAARDWLRVRQAVTLSDLYFIGDRFLARYKDSPSPSFAAVALKQAEATNDGHRLQILGALLPDLSGCSHPHLLRLPPFEDFEHRLPDAMAQRTTEFKLYLADYMDRRGLPAGAMDIFAEPAFRRLLAGLTMSDAHDWRSILAIYGKIDDDLLEEALKRP